MVGETLGNGAVAARPAVQQFLDMQANRFDPTVPDPSRAAMKLLADTVQREALVLTFNDVMLLIGGIFFIALVLIPILQRPGASPLSTHETEAEAA